ncbi:hypothetical protein CI238_00575 [Colletotrichum incanum]|uniref:Uncharacterized protein n=1 Tax=Colletotrichum incanum TaxID=1573173 RepID=A0A166M483_COLIC|nr:hypothetical protein CI238_00575 [Colletotrichum incanum]
MPLRRSWRATSDVTPPQIDNDEQLMGESGMTNRPRPRIIDPIAEQVPDFGLNPTIFPAFSRMPASHHVGSVNRHANILRQTIQSPLFVFVSPRFPRESTAEEPPDLSARRTFTNDDKTNNQPP